MRNRIVALVVGIGVALTACTTTDSTPATTPTTSSPSTSSTTMTPSTTVAPTTVAPQTTTTIDRLAEIQAIFEDLEQRRLQAIVDQDEEAFLGVFANEEYGELSLEVFDKLKVSYVPARVKQDVVSTIADTDSCIAALIRFDNTDLWEDGGTGESIHVIEVRPGGLWGLSWVGEGWTCDGPHPFS